MDNAFLLLVLRYELNTDMKYTVLPPSGVRLYASVQVPSIGGDFN